jgi:hypothetical protein
MVNGYYPGYFNPEQAQTSEVPESQSTIVSNCHVTSQVRIIREVFILFIQELWKSRSPELLKWVLTATSLDEFIHLGGFGPEQAQSLEVPKFRSIFQLMSYATCRLILDDTWHSFMVLWLCHLLIFR